MKKKAIALLGSTGSIGKNVLKVVSHLSSHLEVVALAAHTQIDLLEEQARAFHPTLIAVYDPEKGEELQARLPHIKIVLGLEGLKEVAAYSRANFVVSALAGTIGIEPTLVALESGKQVALANKEVLVSAGALVMELASRKGLPILPIDSEHSALFQCLQGKGIDQVRRLILTASGGPFLRTSPEELTRVTRASVLRHPTWNMGPKVTVDSSTLMNKGLEVIEAHHLFGIPIEKIEVVIHPQSVIHSMVEWIDGSLLAQMSAPDMLIPIQYALTYPEREPGLLPPYDFTRYPTLSFEAPDHSRFPSLSLAYESLRLRGTAPCFLNAANEELVNLFLKEKIHWSEITHYLTRLLATHQPEETLSLAKILETDTLARALVHRTVS